MQSSGTCREEIRYFEKLLDRNGYTNMIYTQYLVSVITASIMADGGSNFSAVALIFTSFTIWLPRRAPGWAVWLWAFPLGVNRPFLTVMEALQ